MSIPCFRLPARLALAACGTLPLLAMPPKVDLGAAAPASAAAPQEQPLGLEAARILAQHLGVGIEVLKEADNQEQAVSDSILTLRLATTLKGAALREWDARRLLYCNPGFAVLAPVREGEAPEYAVLHGMGHEFYRQVEAPGPPDGNSLIRALHHLAHRPVPAAEILEAYRNLLAAPGNIQQVLAALLHLDGHDEAGAAASASGASPEPGTPGLLEEERQLAEALERSMNDYHWPSSAAAAASPSSLAGEDALEEQRQLAEAVALSLALAQPPSPAAAPWGASSYPPAPPRASGRRSFDDGPCPMEIDGVEAPGPEGASAPSRPPEPGAS